MVLAQGEGYLKDLVSGFLLLENEKTVNGTLRVIFKKQFFVF